MSMSVYLSALGIACTLGKGKGEVANALFQITSKSPTIKLDQPKWSLLSKKNVLVGMVPFELPDIPVFKSLNSRNNRLLMLALEEIKIAVADSIAKYGASRVGVVMATSTSGMFERERSFLHKHHTGNELEAYHYSQSEISSTSLFVSQYFDLRGPAYTISTACSSSAKAICSAKRLITAGICDVVIAGGVDTLCDLTLNGFDSLELLSTDICNPFSKNRDGITIGEGAAVFLVTRDGTPADVELSGCGESSDAHHISCPEPNGNGAEVAIQEALSSAGLKPEQICYINLHGTGTHLNDSMESICVNRIFGDKVPCSSTKALTGHTLGASGVLEAAFLWLALTHEDQGKIPLPPHVWDGDIDPSLPSICFTQYGQYAAPINGSYALMSNSFAFGGSNASIILKKKAKPNLQQTYKVSDLIPHEPPMALIDSLVAWQEDFIHCQLTIREDSPFCENGEVPSFIAIEYMAQTIAAWNGLMNLKTKPEYEEPKIGFLLGSRRLELHIPSFRVGDVLNVYGKPQYIDDEMASFDCWIDINSLRVVHAGLNVYSPRSSDEQ